MAPRNQRAEHVYENMRETPYERYVVVEVNYEYNDESYRQEGLGWLHTIFKSREAADGECAKREREHRAKLGAEVVADHCQDCGYYGSRDQDTCPHGNVQFFKVIPVQEDPNG